MKDLINQIWTWLVERNVARLATEFRDRADIEAYTVVEIILVVGTIISGAFCAYYLVKDFLAQRRVSAVKRLARLEELADHDKMEAQRRLMGELEFRFAPDLESAQADEPEDFFEVFYRACPELNPNFPR